MKRVSKHGIRRYPMSRLSRRDIERLYEMFSEVASGGSPRVVVDDYEFEDIGDLGPFEGKRVREVQISARMGSEPLTGNVSLTLARDRAYLFMRDEGDITARGLAESVAMLLRTHRLKGRFLVRPVLAWLLGGALFVAAYVPPERPISVLLLLSLLAAAWGGWSLYMEERRHTLVTLAGKPEGFFVRNKDRLLVGIVVAIVTAVLTLVTTLLVQGKLF